MWAVERYSEKTKAWSVAHTSVEKADSEAQYEVCRRVFPEFIYRLIKIERYSMWEEKTNKKD